MIGRILSTLGIAVHTALTLLYAHEIVKAKLEKIAETETVYNERDYVMVRFARGDYNHIRGVKMMMNDYKFFPIASKYHTTVATERNNIPKPRKG